MFVRLVLYVQLYASYPFRKIITQRDLSARGLAHSGGRNLYFIFTLGYMCFAYHGKSDSHTLPMLLGQHHLSFNTMWGLCICANASPYGFLRFLINSTLNMRGGGWVGRPRPSPPADERHRQGTKGPPPTHPPPAQTRGRAGGRPPHPPPRIHHSRGATGAALRPPRAGGAPPPSGGTATR